VRVRYINLVDNIVLNEKKTLMKFVFLLFSGTQCKKKNTFKKYFNTEHSFVIVHIFISYAHSQTIGKPDNLKVSWSM